MVDTTPAPTVWPPGSDRLSARRSPALAIAGQGLGRRLAAGGLGALLVLSFGLADGGYYGRGWTALTVACSAIVLLGLLLLPGPRAGRRGAALAALLALLTVWVALSARWAVDHAGVGVEVRRCLLYLTAVGAVLVIVDRARCRAFLLGLVGAIAIVVVVGVTMRAVSGFVLDPFYGSLLGEPVGYPNALGILCTIGVLLALGLLATADGLQARLLGSVPGFLVFGLGLTGSRGAALALVLGLVVLVVLQPAAVRVRVGGAALAGVSSGAVAWSLVGTIDAGGGALVAVALALGAAGFALTPHVAGASQRTVVLAACALLAAGVGLLFMRPPDASSSFRTAYWRAALTEVQERPALGAGAGGFFLVWREHRTTEVDVRDAHSLYIEALSELGPVGLVLVVAVVVLPLTAVLSTRGDPIVATAGAAFIAFAAHAGIDWDWEMPVVTLVGLGCAGALLAGRSGPDVQEIEGGSRGA